MVLGCLTRQTAFALNGELINKDGGKGMGEVTRDVGNACKAEVKFTCTLTEANRYRCRYYETAPRLDGKCIYRSNNKCNSPWANGSALGAIHPANVAMG